MEFESARGLAMAGPIGLAVAFALLALSAIIVLTAPTHPRANRVSMGASVIAGLALALAGVVVLATGEPLTASAGDVLGFALVSVSFDALGALFLVVTGAVAALCALYGIGYGSGVHGGADRTAAWFPVFVGSLALVFGSNEVVSFLFAWELMALSSAALVVGARPDRDTARAGYVYLVLTHLATAAIVAGFAVLAATAGTLDFAAFPAAAETLPGPARDAVFVLLVLGFATKAGAIPLHVWLPRAHPVAPSHVSALMSGVMIKAGIYGLVRFVIGVLGPGPEWWGLVLLLIGGLSAVLGVLYALMEHDLKRLLAFSSIENIGIILVGLGVALLAHDHAPALAALGLTAALFHSVNHALFKSVLFLAAGSIQSAAGTRDLNALGGLARSMPITAVAFGIGAAAIAGAPPLNGFASEWLTFQGLLGAGGEGSLSLLARSASLVAVAALGLTAALAVAGFVKATGMSFLALPRSAAAAAARETSRTMGVAMAAAVGGCIALGLAAGPVSVGLRHIASGVIGDEVAATAATGPAVAGVAGLDAIYAAAPLALLLAVLVGGAFALSERGRRARREPTWTCGVAPEPAYEYTASSYGKLIRLYYGPVMRPAREVAVEHFPGTPFPRRVTYRSEVSHVIEDRFYRPIQRLAIAAAELIRRVQSGSLQLYLAYAVIAIVVLLLVTRP